MSAVARCASGWWPLCVAAVAIVAMQGVGHVLMAGRKSPAAKAAEVKEAKDKAKGGVCIVQHDDRTDEEIGDFGALQRRNAGMCKSRESCFYTFTRKPVREDLPPAWQKVAAVQQALAKTRCKAVLWLDADAVLNTRPLELLRRFEGRDVFVTSDRASQQTHTSRFITSIFGMRPTVAGLELLEDWLALYDPKMWHKDSKGKWACNAGEGSSACKGATGVAFERGSFVMHMLDKWAFQINTVAPEDLNSPCQDPSQVSNAAVCQFSSSSEMQVYAKVKDVILQWKPPAPPSRPREPDQHIFL